MPAITENEPLSAKNVVADVASVSEFAKAEHLDRWVHVVQAYPDGKFYELWIDRERPRPYGYLSVKTPDQKVWAYEGDLATLLGVPSMVVKKLNASLVGARRVRIRSMCPDVRAEHDERFSLSYGAPGGILRVKVGTFNPKSESVFYTAIMLSPPVVGKAQWDRGSIVTHLPCTPEGAISAELQEVVERAPQRAKPSNFLSKK